MSKKATSVFSIGTPQINRVLDELAQFAPAYMDAVIALGLVSALVVDGGTDDDDRREEARQVFLSTFKHFLANPPSGNVVATITPDGVRNGMPFGKKETP